MHHLYNVMNNDPLHVGCVTYCVMKNYHTPHPLAAVTLFHIYYSAPDRGAEYCDERVCLSVCVFVCPRSYLWNYTSDLHQIFCACYLRPYHYLMA